MPAQRTEFVPARRMEETESQAPDSECAKRARVVPHAATEEEATESQAPVSKSAESSNGKRAMPISFGKTSSDFQHSAFGTKLPKETAMDLENATAKAY